MYEGDIVNGKPHGKGKMIYDDCYITEGEWKEGVFID